MRQIGKWVGIEQSAAIAQVRVAHEGVTVKQAIIEQRVGERSYWYGVVWTARGCVMTCTISHVIRTAGGIDKVAVHTGAAVLAPEDASDERMGMRYSAHRAIFGPGGVNVPKWWARGIVREQLYHNVRLLLHRVYDDGRTELIETR